MVFLLLGMNKVLSDRELPEGVYTRGIYSHPYSFNNSIEYTGDVDKVDHIFNRFIKKWEIAGASLAIAYEGKLIFTRGYGFADRENQVPAEPYHLFRVASVSKLVTAAAVMKLVEEGRLHLEDKVFGPEGVLNDTAFMHARDPRVYSIRVINLLEHSGGWTPRYGDQMFMPLYIAQQMKSDYPPDLNTIICFALTKRLHFTPGNYSSYSNLGYSILGEVISKVSGMPYEEYVQSNILEPLTIVWSRIGMNTSDKRFHDEVKYYEPAGSDKVPACDGSGSLVYRSDGGNDIHTLGAAGGWIFSSVDLLKFVLSIDGEPSKPDLLSTQSIMLMTGNESPDSLFGWRNADKLGNIWRTGFFAGSTAMIMKQSDGFTWVVLLNSSAWKGADFSIEIMRTMRQVFSQVKQWPEKDLLFQVEARPITPIYKPFVQ